MLNVSLPEFQHLISAVSIPERGTLIESIPVIETLLGVYLSLPLNNAIKSDKALISDWQVLVTRFKSYCNKKRERRNSIGELKKRILTITSKGQSLNMQVHISHSLAGNSLQLSWTCLNTSLATGVKCLTGPYFLMREPTED